MIVADAPGAPQNLQQQSELLYVNDDGVGTKVLRSAAQELLDDGGLNNNDHSEQMNPLASEAQHRPQATAFFAQGLVDDREAEPTQLLSNGEQKHQPVAANEKESDGIQIAIENAINNNKSPLIVDLSMDVSTIN